MEFSFFTGSMPAGFLRREDFGSDFVFGSSTAAFQIEGGLHRDGRGPSIFDTYAKKLDLFYPYGEDAVNHRKYYKEDVKLMKEIGFDAYRFSISWSRILPTGKKESRNQKGIDFYKDLLKNLTDEGIEPMVTLLHFDPPQALEDLYSGFLNPQIVDDFCDYADICFEEFGDKVKHWITVNEPWYFAYAGYLTGELPPGFVTTKTLNGASAPASNSKSVSPDDHEYSSICPPVRVSLKSSSSSSSTREHSRIVQRLDDREHWPYLVAHHQIIAHAKAVKLYRQKYQHVQRGKIGLGLVAQWFVPLDDTQENKDAAKRAMDFMLGWIMEPLFSGNYPENMHKYVKKGLLPEFGADKDMVKGSYDFLALNYYTARYVAHEETTGGDYILDRRVRFYEKKNGVFIGEEKGAAGWIYGYPRGLRDLLVYIKQNYDNPDVYVTENGIDDADDNSATHWNSFYDQKRILFLHDHLSYVKQAKREGVNVKGHFVWSLLDNMELNQGYKSRFGIIYVDYDDGSKRIPKLSASWYRNFLAN